MAGSRVVAVFSCGVVEPFFSSAAAPHIHPFVISVGWYSAAAQNRVVLTPSILVRPSRGRRPPHSGQRRRNPPVHWAVQAGLATRGPLLPRKKGRCNRISPRSPLLVLDYLCLVKRRRALLASNPTRDNQAKDASRTRGCLGRKTGAAPFLTLAAWPVGLLLLQHVPNNRRQATHCCHPRDLRPATPLDPDKPLLHASVATQDVQHHLRENESRDGTAFRATPWDSRCDAGVTAAQRANRSRGREQAERLARWAGAAGAWMPPSPGVALGWKNRCPLGAEDGRKPSTAMLDFDTSGQFTNPVAAWLSPTWRIREPAKSNRTGSSSRSNIALRRRSCFSASQ